MPTARARLARPHPRRRRPRVRRARLRRRPRRPHRPPRPRQQGDALLPLQEQAGASTARCCATSSPAPPTACRPSPPAPARPPRRSTASIAALAGLHRASTRSSRHHAARGRRRRRAPRSRDARPRSPACRAPFGADRRRRASPQGAFRPVHPVFAYFSMFAPIVFYLAGAPIRKELAELHLINMRALSPDEFVAHLQDAMRRSPCAATSRRHREAAATMTLPRALTLDTRNAPSCWPRFSRRAVLCACSATKPPADRVRVSGPGRGDRRAGRGPGRRPPPRARASPKATASKAGDSIARLDTADAELALARARAEREQADAQLRLLRAGRARRGHPPGRGAGRRRRRPTSARPRRSSPSAQADVERFEALLASNSGSRKQRDDAVTRRDVAEQRVAGARASACARRARTSARLRAGARREEIDAARARVAAADAQIATWQKAIADATVTAPVAGIVTEKLVDVGELVQPARAARRHHRSRSRVGERLRRRAGRAAAAPRPAGDALHRRRRRRHSGHGQLHLGEGRVHAAQRADGGGPLEARLPRQGRRSTTRTACSRPGMPVEAEIPVHAEREAASADVADSHQRSIDRHEALRRDDGRPTSCRCRSSAARCSA